MTLEVYPIAFQEIPLALEQLGEVGVGGGGGGGGGAQLLDRDAQFLPLTRNALKGQERVAKLYISPNFYKKIGVKIHHSLILFISVETIQIFHRPEKSGVEMIEHMSGMRVFSFLTDFRRNLILL